MKIKAIAGAAAATLLVMGSAAHAQVLLSEGFESGTPAGWSTLNFSDQTSAQAWFQGYDSPAPYFAAQAGSATSYLASSAFIGALDGNGDPTGTIDGYLLTPTLSMSLETSLSYWTRTIGSNTFGETLYVGVLLTGSNNINFIQAINSVNFGDVPAAGVYPASWTQFTVNLAAQGAGATGRFVFNNFIEDASQAGNYIGLDSILVTAVPEPGTWLLMAGGLLAMSQLRRRS